MNPRKLGIIILASVLALAGCASGEGQGSCRVKYKILDSHKDSP